MADPVVSPSGVVVNAIPYIDKGTGAYPGPPAEVVYGSEHNPEPTGLVPGPPKEVTVESPPDHLAGPTGAYPTPGEVTFTAHPVEPAKAEPETKAKAVKTADVEDKAVKPATTKRKGA